MANQYRYTEEPESCRACGSTERMDLLKVDVDGAPAEAWICDECGEAHIRGNDSDTP